MKIYYINFKKKNHSQLTQESDNMDFESHLSNFDIDSLSEHSSFNGFLRSRLLGDVESNQDSSGSSGDSNQNDEDQDQ